MTKREWLDENVPGWMDTLNIPEYARTFRSWSICDWVVIRSRQSIQSDIHHCWTKNLYYGVAYWIAIYLYHLPPEN